MKKKPAESHKNSLHPQRQESLMTTTDSAFIDLRQCLEFLGRDASILPGTMHGLLEILDSGEQLLLAIL